MALTLFLSPSLSSYLDSPRDEGRRACVLFAEYLKKKKPMEAKFIPSFPIVSKEALFSFSWNIGQQLLIQNVQIVIIYFISIKGLTGSTEVFVNLSMKNGQV